MRKITRKPIAALCADLHLTLHRPACRLEEDWMDVQAWYLAQLKRIAGGLPVLCAGDVFDRWNVSPELIRFALDHLPDGMMAIPGQHDLPNHRLDEVHRSAYGVLVRAGKILCAAENQPLWIGKTCRVWGCAWGQDLRAMIRAEPPCVLDVALLHRYVWTEGASYQGAKSEHHVNRLPPPARTYSVVVCGDNHQEFDSQLETTTVFNCGGFIRRRSDERHRQPRVGLLFDDGSVRSVPLRTDRDKIAERTERESISGPAAQFREFLEGLERLGEHSLDFRAAVALYLESGDIPDDVREILLASIDPDTGAKRV